MYRTVLRSFLWMTAALGSVATALAANTSRHTPAESVALAPAPRVAPDPATEDNPRVEPGLVKWHASFIDAQAASRKSGKPVLLFHMMGQLDRQFC
jgi:hypothetical protein